VPDPRPSQNDGDSGGSLAARVQEIMSAPAPTPDVAIPGPLASANASPTPGSTTVSPDVERAALALINIAIDSGDLKIITDAMTKNKDKISTESELDKVVGRIAETLSTKSPELIVRSAAMLALLDEDAIDVACMHVSSKSPKLRAAITTACRKAKAQKNKKHIATGFSQDTEGWIYHTDQKGNSTRLASSFSVVARTRSHDGDNHGVQIEWLDCDKMKHKQCIPMEAMVSDFTTVWSTLAHQGLLGGDSVAIRSLLFKYIQSQINGKIAAVRIVEQVGWHDNCYVMNDEAGTIIGPPGADQLYLQSKFTCAKRRISGDVASWKSEVGSLCPGNSRLLLAACLGFASPTLEIIDHESFGVHLIGGSSKGKSTTLFVPCSIFGSWKDPRKILEPISWSQTANALEGTCVQHNDQVLTLDEINLANEHEIGRCAYSLMSGGKIRMNANTSLRPTQTWRIVVLSNGEQGISDMLRSVGKKTNAGQELRLLEIVADIPGAHGVFEDLHGFADGAAFANHLKQVCTKNYGAIGIEYIRWLSQNRALVQSTHDELSKQFMNDFLPPLADGQVVRAAGHFAAVATAGVLATRSGVTGWNAAIDQVWQAIGRCFKDWLDHRGTNGPAEDEKIIAQCRLLLERDQHCFALTTCPAVPLKKYGYRDPSTNEWHVTPEAFKTIFAAGFGWKRVADVLCGRGFMTSPQSATVHLGAHGTKRVYTLLDSILA